MYYKLFIPNVITTVNVLCCKGGRGGLGGVGGWGGNREGSVWEHKIHYVS